MTDDSAAQGRLPTPELPEPTVVRVKRTRLSLAWLVPIAAVVIGAVLIVRTLLAAGPEITITFRNAEGLEAGRTEVRYKEVTIGKVTKVGLSPDRERVLVTVKLDKAVANLAVADTRFWVVRPRVSLAGVSGLGTLFSGSYIGVDAGEIDEPEIHFTGLETPPFVLRGDPGRVFTLSAQDLGSLDIGSPVYYKRTPVGRVAGYMLDPARDVLDVQIVVDPPNDKLITTHTRFWAASGIDVTLGAGGFTLETQSLVSVLVGGVAFAMPLDASASAPVAPNGHRFEMFSNRKAAMAQPDGAPLRVRMVFDQTQRGLAAGASVDMLGVDVGTVRSVALRDGAKGGIAVEVLADVFPQRLGNIRRQFKPVPGAPGSADAQFVKRAIDNGLRAQVRTGNLLTGQLYIALDFVPKAAPASVDTRSEFLAIPTVRGTLADLQPQIADIVARLGKVKFDEIGSDLQTTLRSASAAGDGLQQTLASANAAIKQLSPEAQKALADVSKTLATAQTALVNLDRNALHSDAALQRNLNQTLQELQRAAQALRVLADYLQQHPEAIVRGKSADADPGKPSGSAR
jgi:paraquat-inducible protein B